MFIMLISHSIILNSTLLIAQNFVSIQKNHHIFLLSNLLIIYDDYSIVMVNFVVSKVNDSLVNLFHLVLVVNYNVVGSMVTNLNDSFSYLVVAVVENFSISTDYYYYVKSAHSLVAENYPDTLVTFLVVYE